MRIWRLPEGSPRWPAARRSVCIAGCGARHGELLGIRPNSLINATPPSLFNPCAYVLQHPVDEEEILRAHEKSADADLQVSEVLPPHAHAHGLAMAAIGAAVRSGTIAADSGRQAPGWRAPRESMVQARNRPHWCGNRSFTLPSSVPVQRDLAKHHLDTSAVDEGSATVLGRVKSGVEKVAEAVGLKVSAEAALVVHSQGCSLVASLGRNDVIVLILLMIPFLPLSEPSNSQKEHPEQVVVEEPVQAPGIIDRIKNTLHGASNAAGDTVRQQAYEASQSAETLGDRLKVRAVGWDVDLDRLMVTTLG